MPREDQILVGVYAALQYALDNGALLGGRPTAGDWVLGRRDEDYLYLIPGEILPIIRAELDDDTLTSNAVAAALEDRGLLYPSRRQGRSTPAASAAPSPASGDSAPLSSSDTTRRRHRHNPTACRVDAR